MKFRLALATIAFSMLTAVAANAAPTDVSVSVTPASGTSFTGVLDNTTASNIVIDEYSLGWQPASANEVNTSTGFPDTLAESIFNNGGVTLVPGTPQSFDFNFDSNVSLLTLTVKSAGAVVGQGSSVPEPGSVAMLIGTGMGGGLLFMRRRRK